MACVLTSRFTVEQGKAKLSYCNDGDVNNYVLNRNEDANKYDDSNDSNKYNNESKRRNMHF